MSWATIDCWQEDCLKTGNHSSVTSAYVQMAWFVTLGCEQQSVSFPALLIGNQGVIEKLEESRPESRKIETVTSLGIAWQSLFFFQDALAYKLWIIHFQPHVIFCWIFLWQNCSDTMNCWVEQYALSSLDLNVTFRKCKHLIQKSPNMQWGEDGWNAEGVTSLTIVYMVICHRDFKKQNHFNLINSKKYKPS